VKPCPFCGGAADPAGWLNSDGQRGPECEECGATAVDADAWNYRAPVLQRRDWRFYEASELWAALKPADVQ
jgi:hypothetical protein